MKRRQARITASVVIAGIGLTVVSTWLAMQGVTRDRAADLALASGEARGRLERQIDTYTETLFALRSAFATDPALTRAGFRDFLASLAPGDRHPGARAITFNRAIRRAERGAFRATPARGSEPPADGGSGGARAPASRRG